MTTGLSDKQLLQTFDLAYATAALNGGGHVERASAGLRAVADLAITYAEAEIHGLRAELQVAEDQANNLAGDNAAQETEIARLRMELTLAQRR